MRAATGFRSRVAALALAALALAGCAPAAERAQVVVTTNVLGDITREIIGDQAPVSVLMKPNADPHSFGVSAQQAAQFERADLVIANGLGLEEGVARNIDAAAQAGVPTLAVGEHVDPLQYAQDESAGAPDPHFWTDPLRVARAVDVIARHVVEHVDGVDPAAVRANAERYRGEVEALHATISEQFAAIPPERRTLVTNHHVFGYLAQRYDFEVIGAVIPSGTTLASPSASDLAGLAEQITTEGVPAIFADTSQPDRLARALAEQAGVRVRIVPLFSESLSRPGEGAATYLEMTTHNANAIATALGG
ncbi:zinc ABC transporter substrate-binding protein AztC [Saccharopolyspora cebuensis]|uniref:Zinc ABC transporter substrate-binding protein AztC n=1 Tax=Saccharopolyspora cebuensis TaxID=418759 RepID=A0ABV4CM84_9PSEU